MTDLELPPEALQGGASSSEEDSNEIQVELRISDATAVLAAEEVPVPQSGDTTPPAPKKRGRPPKTPAAPRSRSYAASPLARTGVRTRAQAASSAPTTRPPQESEPPTKRARHVARPQYVDEEDSEPVDWEPRQVYGNYQSQRVDPPTLHDMLGTYLAQQQVIQQNERKSRIAGLARF